MTLCLEGLQIYALFTPKDTRVMYTEPILTSR